MTDEETDMPTSRKTTAAKKTATKREQPNDDDADKPPAKAPQTATKQEEPDTRPVWRTASHGPCPDPKRYRVI